MLRAERLSKSFGAFEVTRDVSLEVPAGVRHAIIGPNGAGKTTLFNLLSGELRPRPGGSTSASARSPACRRTAGRGSACRAASSAQRLPGLTVREQPAAGRPRQARPGRIFWRRLGAERGLAEKAERVAAAGRPADRLDRRVGALSYGAVRQLEIGLALAGRAPGAAARRADLGDEPGGDRADAAAGAPCRATLPC